MIAITFAHPSESRDFLRLTSGRHPEVTVAHTGIGAKACRQSIEQLLDGTRFDLLISSGFAGATDHSLGVGDLVLAENYSDPRLLATVRDLIDARVTKLATTDRVIADPEERRRLATEHPGAALDMETSWIARACAARGLPLLSLRAISDTPSAPFPAPPEVLFDLERQKTRFSNMSRYLLRHPAAIVRLIHFQRRIATVRLHLAVELSLLVREFA